MQKQSLTTSQQQMYAQPVSEQWLLWKTKPTSPPSPQKWHYMAWNIPLVNSGQLSQLCPLLASCLPPHYLLRSNK